MVDQRAFRFPVAARRRLAAAASAILLAGCALASAAAWTDAGIPSALDVADGTGDLHLVISEVITGGTSASDEFIEIYNPSLEPLPLEGLELVYVTASGATITRKASWPAGSAELGPGAHLLVVNEAGIYAGLGDAAYASGLAATGGSVALRIEGATTAIDAVGWGGTTSSWVEGIPAAAPAAGHSIERLPGGGAGSGQDTDQNSVDFVEREMPEPQNLASPPIQIESTPPSASPSSTPVPSGAATESATAVPSAPTPTPAATATTVPTPVATPTPTDGSPAISVADARALPNGSVVTVAGVALSASDFNDGGGYLVDGTAGIAILVSGGTFARGDGLLVTGIVDDRYYQRTVRADGAGVSLLGPAAEPAATTSATGAAGEALEGQLLDIDAIVQGSPTTLSGGLAYDLDDGSGPLRVVVGGATGIDSSGWQAGVSVHLRGVLGQRDSSGGGTSGYRLQPRDRDDVVAVTPPIPSQTPSPTASSSANPSASPAPGTVTIDEARRASTGSQVVVEGVVTMAPGFIDPDSAIVQDATAAILLRLSGEARGLSLGDHVRVTGTRTTKSGMEALRVSVSPMALPAATAPQPQRSATGSLGEPQEAVLVVVRGAVATSPRRSSAQNVYFDLDDGSGPIRIYISPDVGIGTEVIEMGSWLDVTGVLAQETTGRQPERGYRIWPRRSADVSVLAGGSSVAGSLSGSTSKGGSSGTTGGPGGSARTSRPAAGPRTAADGLVAPRLHRPAATLSPAPSVVSTTTRRGSGATPRTIAALVVALAALLLLAAAWLFSGPRLLDRLLARVHAAGLPTPATEAPDEAVMPGAAPAALVALEVMDGGAMATGRRGPSAR